MEGNLSGETTGTTQIFEGGESGDGSFELQTEVTELEPGLTQNPIQNEDEKTEETPESEHQADETLEPKPVEETPPVDDPDKSPAPGEEKPPLDDPDKSPAPGEEKPPVDDSDKPPAPSEEKPPDQDKSPAPGEEKPSAHDSDKSAALSIIGTGEDKKDTETVVSAEEYNFGALEKEEEGTEASFSLLKEEGAIEEAKEASKEEEPEPKSTKKKKKKKKNKQDLAKNVSEYSSLHISGSRSFTITGDFTEVRKSKIPSMASEETVEEEEEVEEEEVVVEEKVMTEAERLELYAKYDRLMKEHDEEKTKNDELLRRLANYYKKKKMYHVLHEGKVQLDAQKKYEKQLDEFGRKTELSKKEQLTLQTEIADLKRRCATQERETVQAFEKLQRDEYEVGNEIVNSEAGKNLEEKLIERYLKRQKIQLNNLIKIRYDYIKIRNKLNETQDALSALDNLGPDLHLIDYEQLKLDNRNLHDKLEERELELTRVRIRCQNAVQILAHRREKTAALDADIAYLNERLEGVTGEFEDVREQLNQLKVERDAYRADINQIKANSGLLTKPKLLRDLCYTMDELDLMSKKLFVIKRECQDVSNKVKQIRINMASEEALERIKNVMDDTGSIKQGDTVSDIWDN